MFSKKFDIKLQTVYRWLKEKKIPFQKVTLTIQRFEIDEKAEPPKSYEEWKKLRNK